MEKIIYSENGGLGIILDSNENENDFIDTTKSFIINNQTMMPNDNTTLFGMYDAPAIYVGALKEGNNNCMVFCLGSNDDLFESKTYYSCFYWINERRIANKYKEGTVRDFIFVNGVWK
jgi:hypothetical protein